MFPEQPDNLGIALRGEPFPVVTSAALYPVRRKLLRRPGRSPQDLPEQSGGTVLVFQSNNRFSLAPPGPRMLSSDVAVRATAAVVVSIRQQLVPLVAPLPSVNGENTVHLYATFYCKVTDPVLVLEAGCFDVRPTLQRHLVGDAKLRMFGAREDVADNLEVLQRILARTQARAELQPPAVPGMRVDLVEVSLGIHRNGWTGANDPEDPYDATVYDRDEDVADGPPRDGYAAYPDDSME